MILVLNGPLGVGKTETSWALMRDLGHAALVDGDYAASARPFDFYDPAHLERALAAILASARHHLEADVPHLVVNWVFETSEQLTALIARLEALHRPVHCFRLFCDAREHEARIRNREQGRAEAEVRGALERGRALAEILDAAGPGGALGHPVDTTCKSAAAVAEEILRHARSAPDARALLRSAAPELGDEALSLRTDQYDKVVWAVGARHVLRLARSNDVREKLSRERALLAHIAGSTTLAIPRTVYAAPDGEFDLLSRAPGEPVESSWFPAQATSVQRAVARTFGRFPAELHEAITADEARALGVPPSSSLHPPDWVRDRLVGRMGSAQGDRLLDAMLAIVDSLYEHTLPPVLLHDDIGHHNAGFDPATGEVLGVFDFTEARVGDPHRDLRYAFTYEPFAEEAIRTYEGMRGVELQRARLRALHAWSALTALAWEIHQPGDPELLPQRRGWVNRVANWDLRFVDRLG